MVIRRFVFLFELIKLKFMLTSRKPIETALRECAQIPVKEFALIVMLENGEEKTYSSTSLKPHWQKLFNDRFRRDFHQCAQWVNTEASFPSSGQFGTLSQPVFQLTILHISLQPGEFIRS